MGILGVDTQTAFFIFSLMFFRMIMIINLVPFLGSRNAPGPVKLGLAVIFSVMLWPFVTANIHAPVPLQLIEWIMLLLKEIFVGYTIGFVTAEIFYAVEMSGQLIDVSRGANQIQLMIPELQERSSAFGTFSYQLLLAIFLASGLHSYFFQGLLRSFETVPVLQFPAFSSGTNTFFSHVFMLLPEMFWIAVNLALPIFIVCLVIDFGFGLINRIAPQINAFFLALPAKALGGIAIFFFSLTLTFQQYIHFSGQLLKRLLETIELFR